MTDSNNLLLWELVNPSDKFTFYAPSVEVAGVAVALISTSYGAIQAHNPTGERSPILFGWDNWLKEKGINDTHEFVKDNAQALISAYESLLICDESRRDSLDETIAALPEDERQQWIADYHDSERSSTNDIRRHGLAIADTIRKLHLKDEACTE